ncbi:sulfotransferase family protein [Geminocystis herdmanii]|uniref:sulfotransferase family protein n=1 Tax=Geminocystis herdmanii TaxID=669359 RepID=UPI00034786DF|nr:sulfotransferase [Geminocystis herdmanii]
MAKIQQPILIITGMHRSGTSLVSSLLQSAGLNIGKNLVAGNEGNIKGHFENKDFVDFHEKVLYSLGINQIGWTLEKDLSPPPAYQDEAKNLIELSLSQNKPWGWKDPRTSLFLNFWYNLIPDSPFLFIYRSPWEVLDSLFRRGDDIFHRHPEFALQIWMSYNQQILEFYRQYQDNCLLLNLNQITANPDFLIEAIAKKLKVELSKCDRNLYEARLLKQLSHNSQRPYEVKQFFPSAFALYEELNAISGYQDDILSSLSQESCQGWLLQDWVDVKRIEKELAHEKKDSTEHLDRVYQEIGDLRHQVGALEWDLQQSQQESTHKSQELENIRSHFLEFEREFQETESNLQQELVETRQHLIKSEEDFNQVRSYLQQELEETRQHLIKSEEDFSQVRSHLQQELEETKRRLQPYEEELPLLRGYFEKSQRELKETQDELHNIRSYSQELEEKITAMESSKFWRIRSKWFKVKRGLNLS